MTEARTGEHLTTGAEPVAEAPPGSLWRRRAGEVTTRYSLILVLAVVVVIFSIVSPDTYPTSGNLTAMLNSQSVPLLLALAALFPLRVGDFDLSISATMVFTSALAPVLWSHGLPLGLAIIAAIACGVLIGTVNSVFISGIGINAFVVTLATMTLLEGLVFWLTSGNLVTNIPHGLLTFGRSSWFGIQSSVYYGWILCIVVWYLFEFTPVGRYLLFVGGNRETARLAGIRVKRIRALAFIAAGLISAFAGLVIVGSQGVADPTVGPSYLLPPYAAAFLGLAAVQIGRFNVWGTVIAVYLLTAATTGLLLLGANQWVTNVFNGAALLFAISFAHLLGRRRKS